MAASDLRYISGDVHRVSEVSIVLLGCRNSGKSLAGNVILGLKDLDLQESTWCVKRHGEVAGRKITLVEAPGWCSDKPVTESTELLNEEIVCGVSVCPPGPQAVLVVVNCGDVFKENDRERLAGCLNLLGDEVWSHTIVLFTFGDFLGDVTIERHIEREGVALQWLVEKCGNRYHVFKNNMDDNSQVMELLEKIEEMVARNRGCHLEMDTTMLPNVDESRREDESKERRMKGMKFSPYFMNVCMYFLKFLQVFWFSSELWSIAHSPRVRMGSPRDLQFPPASQKHAEDFREPSGTGKGAQSTSTLHPDAGHVSADTEIFTPELVDNYPNDKNRMKYRFFCSRAGQFKCKLTDLVFEMEGKGEVLYRIVSWDGCASDELKGKEPAGPLYSIDCLEGSIRHLHLPHCEIDWSKYVLQLTTAHVTGGNVEIIQPLKLTSTHVIVDVRRFSLVGLLKALLFQAYPIRAQVLLFCEETGKHRMSKLHIHLLPGNVPVEEVQKQRNCTYTYIETRSKCQLTPDKTYRPCFRTTDSDYVSQPEDETFVRDYGPDYHPTFEVQFNTELDKFTLSLLDENSQEVWRPDLALLTEGFREHDGTGKDARSAATLHLDSGHASADTELIFSPELVENCPKDKNRVVYSFLCPHAGLFMCKLTNLVFEMEGKGVVVYRIVSWDSCVSDGLQKDSAGPLYSIECLEGSIRHLHLPHCETRTDVVKLTVAHATGGNVEIIQPLKVTDTHVIIHIHGLSLFGILKALLFQEYPIRAQVLLFRKKMTGKLSRSKLNIHLLPGNVPVKEVQKQRECNEYIETTSKCQLTPGKLYRLCCKTTDRDYEPQPEEETFDLDYGPNYHPTFEVLFNTELDEITLSLLDENGQQVWTPREVSLLTDTEAVSANTDKAGADFVDKHRETLIQSVPSVIEIADVLKEHWPWLCNHRSAELAACIHAAGGYVVHHTGDAILAEWVEENVQMSDTISHVLQCAFTTLKVEKLRSKVPDDDLPIKIALSAGEFTKITIGDKFCAVIGPAVEEIRSIQARMQNGDIILCPEAWRQCNRQNLTVKNIENKEAVKVRCSTEQQSISVDDLHHYNTDIHMTKNPITYLITHKERETFIRCFMIQTARIKIQVNQQQEAPNPGLPEIWPTTIMFVYLQFVLTQTDLRFGRQEVSETIAEQMFRCRGKICSVFFFEEGCMFVCAVGLPGDKRQDKTAQAVQAAFRIHETCHQQIDSVSSISIGVTTGRVKYKFEQSPLRECCRVYGDKVRGAAELSRSNPGVVSCDEPTQHYSLLPLSTFRPLKRSVFVVEPGLSSSEMDSRRLAFAIKQTMLDEECEVVKCASVIGQFSDNNFNFELLKITLPCMNEPELIIHLRSLFRAGVFKCASEPRNVSSTKTCYCENTCEEYIWFSMDPVWTCRQMSFCNKDVMEIVYMDVKKCDWRFRLIHKYWAQFLEEKAYRCSKCCARSFLFGEEVATDDNNEQLQEIYKAIQHYEVFRSQGIRSRNQACPTEGNGNDTENFLAKVKSVLTEARDRTTAGSCECAQLMETVLIPRMRHWRLAGDVPRTFHYLLESAAACVYLQNDDGALEYLTETRSILENSKEGKPAFPSAYPENAQIGEFQPAFMHRLTGEILFKAGKILEAEESFKNALKILNCKLPRSSVAQSFKLIYEKLKKLHYRSKQFQIPEKRKIDRLQECINCLSFLWKIDCMRGRLRIASLAITMEINLAIQSTDPFKILYSAIDYLKYSQFIGEKSECERLEAFLCRTCAGLSDHPEGRRLISHLTRTLAVVKMCTGDLEQSIECTIRAQQLGEVQNRPGLDMRTTAALHLPLLLTDRYSESVQQIQTLSREMSSSIDKGWFYAACMNFLLYAGFVFRPFEECLAFVEESRSDANLEADKSLMLHLYSAVALWYAQLENWEMFAVFFDNAYKVYTRIPTSIESVSGGVILLECSILLFRKELTDCNRQRRITLKKSQKLFSDFTQRFGKSHIFGPRVLHLNAYLHQLTGRETLAQDLFKEALVLCEEQGNLLEQNWIRQSQVDCSGACSHTPVEWSTAVLSMPRWDKAAKLQPEELLNYRLTIAN